MPRFLNDLIELLSGRASGAERDDESTDCRFDDDDEMPVVAPYYQLAELPDDGRHA